ncbi:uncharacterized protein LOC115093949 [Rhinatrema bivittatum]|uniref:uncharacterized protein LOC115093949 n=1 Tax=Rhinatrema bivittatum TaxID=194408 RepID=UPI00112DCC84|nr:uncharacterized protein LOC115093949 [Rhinatrema bivittatum]
MDIANEDDKKIDIETSKNKRNTTRKAGTRTREQDKEGGQESMIDLVKEHDSGWQSIRAGWRVPTPVAGQRERIDSSPLPCLLPCILTKHPSPSTPGLPWSFLHFTASASLRNASRSPPPSPSEREEGPGSGALLRRHFGKGSGTGRSGRSPSLLPPRLALRFHSSEQGQKRRGSSSVNAYLLLIQDADICSFLKGEHVNALQWFYSCCWQHCLAIIFLENDIFLGWEKGAYKKWGKSKKRCSDLTLEEMKKQAAVQCLRSASDEVSSYARFQ